MMSRRISGKDEESPGRVGERGLSTSDWNKTSTFKRNGPRKKSKEGRKNRVSWLQFVHTATKGKEGSFLVHSP